MSSYLLFVVLHGIAAIVLLAIIGREMGPDALRGKWLVVLWILVLGNLGGFIYSLVRLLK